MFKKDIKTGLKPKSGQTDAMGGWCPGVCGKINFRFTEVLMSFLNDLSIKTIRNDIKNTHTPDPGQTDKQTNRQTNTQTKGTF